MEEVQNIMPTDSVHTDKVMFGPPASTNDSRRRNIVWRNIVMFSILHIAALYGAFLLFTQAKWQTYVFVIVTIALLIIVSIPERTIKSIYFLYLATTVGVTAGAHRLWSHKAYKAKLPLRVILVIFDTLAFQNSVVEWVRDHRMHHKYCDTDADPHNAERGFFFSHMGWLLVRKHPEIKNKGQNIDMSDLWNDPILRFQHKNYLKLVILTCFILPTYIPTLWGEKAYASFYVCAILRYTLALHATWLVNSAAHMWGTRPYDKQIRPAEIKIVSFLAVGEGFHNYHHTFPWDYRTAELGGYSLNLTKLFIDAMAKIGWAYDLKSVPEEFIEKRVKRTGDGSHPVWGWDDPDLTLEDRKASIIF